MRKFIFCFLLLFCFGSNISSQSIIPSNPSKPELQAEPTSTEITQRCHTMENFEIRLQNDPEFRKRQEEYLRDYVKPDINTAYKIPCNGNNTIDVPLAFHFDNSFSCANSACILSEIQDAIATLNVDFGDNTGSPNAANCPAAYPDISTGTCINFYLAVPPACSNLDVNCDGAITIGQFQGGYNATGGSGAGNCWDDYLNVFVQSPQANNLGVSDQIPGYLNAAGPGEGVSLGAPYFGGSGGACSPFDTDNNFNMGGTLAHEIGHYLGLPHIWGDVNGGGCGGDDGFADTPNQASQYFGCPTGCVNSGCGGSQQTANFMNYTNDACMDLFTEDQAAAMNFYANQFFGGLNIPPANPAELYTQCTGNACQTTCPTQVITPYSNSEDVCAGVGAYTLPSTYNGLVLDDASSADYTWSTGNYLSAGGTTLNNTTINLTNPAGCAPDATTYYLNVSCTDNTTGPFNAGSFTLNVYPDPTQFTEADLVTVSGENTCNEPVLTANCAGVTITPGAGNPNFPVAAGQSGTANYTVTYTAPAGTPNCCTTGGGTGGEVITNGDFEAGTNGWTETEEVPSGTPNPNPFGIIGVSNSPVNGTNDAWFGGWGGTSTLTLSQPITIPPTCGEANLTFDFSMACAGGGITLDVAINGVVLGTLSCTDGASGSIAPFDLIAAGAATGNVTISFIGTEDGTGTDEPDIYIDNVSVVTANCSTATTCDIAVTADYDCAGCTDCNDPTCITTQACNDNDPCTENDEQTILSSDGSVCVPCAGTAIASCSGSTNTVNCNDNDPCTENDVRIVDACDGSVCVPCAGTAIASCSGSTNTVNCNDGDPCTTNDVRIVDACDGSVCVPCAGTAIPSCSGSTNTVNCNDNDPCTTNDVRIVDACDGSICVPCAGTAIPSCSGSTSVVACNDNDPCTTNDVQTVDDCNGSICVPCAGTAIASCSGSTSVVACNDGDPCTTNDVQTVDDCDGSICIPCAGTAIPSCSGSTSVVACNDFDPCTTNDVQTVDDCNGSICVPCAGTAIPSCSGSTSVVSCNDGDPCTEDDIQTVDICDGSICVPCAGTAIPSCSGSTSVVACNDNDPCTTNDVQTVDTCNGSICVPCAGTAIPSCSGSTSVVACNDGDPCTEDDLQTVDDCDGSICVPCAGTAIPSCSGSTSVVACNDFDPCTNNDVQTVDDCNGSICVPCAGTAIPSCSGSTSVVSCNDGDPCTTNDVQTVDICDGSVCVPCAGVAIADCSGSTSVVTCDDNDPCTINDVQTIDDCDSSVCVPCAGTFTPSACCSDVDLNINFDGFPSQTSWDITEISTGNVVTSGGGYSSQPGNSNMGLPGVACLLDGCYELNFYDAINNGMCPFRASASSLGTFITPGTLITPGSVVATLGSVVSPGLCGNYSLTDINGTTLTSGGGSFGAQESTTFCLSGGVATLWEPDNNEAYAKQQQPLTSLKVFPTLTKDDLFVEIREVSQGQINIVDMNGQILQRYEQIQPQMQLNVSDLPAGIYFVQMVANDIILVEKFVKK